MHGLSSKDPRCIHTVEEAVKLIDEIGFLPLFANDIPGFSLEERTVPKDWWSGNPKKDPWEWRVVIAREGKVAYGKFFEKKAGFVSLKWFPQFANLRRDGYDFDSLWDDELASRREKKIMDLFGEGGASELLSPQIKEKAGFGKDGEKNFEGTLTDLQMQAYLCVKDFRQRINKKGEPYGWAVALYATPETMWGYDFVTGCYRKNKEESAQAVAAQIRRYFPDVTDRQLKKIVVSQKAVL